MKIEKKLGININYGEFNAIEVKHYSNQYKYIILKNDDNSILLKKKTLNWDNYEEQKHKKKKKKIEEDIDKTGNKLSKMVI
jgi:archaellin